MKKEKAIQKFRNGAELTQEERNLINVGEYKLNQVKCLKCNEVIVSAHRHDFRFCQCGNIAVDGGTWYLRRIGHGISDNSYQDMSIKYKSAEKK